MRNTALAVCDERGTQQEGCDISSTDRRRQYERQRWPQAASKDRNNIGLAPRWPSTFKQRWSVRSR
ncbi:hypothetical protein AB0E55_09600 [Amycolatopsis keratiniphila]|uniref:hypothetical protein n=1 Tax=Amycolatopsis keratiniphila TaxID=129921 RepID=UPI003404A995